MFLPAPKSVSCCGCAAQVRFPPQFTLSAAKPRPDSCWLSSPPLVCWLLTLTRFSLTLAPTKTNNSLAIASGLAIQPRSPPPPSPSLPSHQHRHFIQTLALFRVTAGPLLPVVSAPLFPPCDAWRDWFLHPVTWVSLLHWPDECTFEFLALTTGVT